MKTILLRAMAVTLLLQFGITSVSSAQKDATADTKSKTSLQTNVQYCDLALPVAEKRLKEAANASCATQYDCINCRDRATGFEIYATMVVQPDDPNCKSVQEISVADGPASRGTAPALEQRFRAELLQSPCFAGGTNLEVYLPGYGQASKEFSYLWEIDGKKGGHLPSIQCACGKEFKVRVLQLATGESVTLVGKLNSTCGSADGK